MSVWTLHYIYDPLCGWCYGSAPLLSAAAESDRWRIQLHAGGMMAGSNRQPLTPALRQFVLKHDVRIAELTGQPFGTAYREGLLHQEGVVFDSEPPITALLAVASLGDGQERAMLARIQRAHFMEGRRIAEREVLADLAADIGLEPDVFRDAFEKWTGAPTLRHIDESRALLERVNGAGFPTFVLERSGQLRTINSSRHLGRPAEWMDALQALVASA